MSSGDTQDDIWGGREKSEGEAPRTWRLVSYSAEPRGGWRRAWSTVLPRTTEAAAVASPRPLSPLRPIVPDSPLATLRTASRRRGDAVHPGRRVRDAARGGGGGRTA